MATATASPTFDSLRRSIRSNNVVNNYLLHGEEGFFIDELIKDFENLLPESDREFNLYVLYGTDTSAAEVVNRCHGYPLMADRQVVVVKEAQNWDAADWDVIARYMAHPVPSTVLVAASRGKTVKSKDLTNALTATRGVNFESKKLKEGSVAQVVEALVKNRGLNIEPKGLEMFCDYVGSDVSRLYNQIEKLSVALEPGATITPEVIERNIGISKDYNVFELRDAIFQRDLAKCVKIIEFFRKNPKNNPAIPVPAAIFGGFSELLIYHFLRDKSPASVMGALGFKWQSMVTRVERAAKAYNARQVIDIITALRNADRQMKGIGSRQDPYDILRDLIYYILNTRGIQ